MSYIFFREQKKEDYLSVSCLRVHENYEEIEICYTRGVPACFELPFKEIVNTSNRHSYEIYYEFLSEKAYSRIQEYKIRKQMNLLADRVFDYPVPTGIVYAGIRKSTEYVENSASIVVYVPSHTEDCFDIIIKALAESQYDFEKKTFSNTLAGIVKVIPQAILAHFYVTDDSWCFLNIYGTRVKDIFGNLFSETFDPQAVPIRKNGKIEYRNNKKEKNNV